MSIQPKYHWTFREIKNFITQDVINGATARLSNVVLSGQGRIGNAVALNGSDDSYISLGHETGQFGQADFTVAFEAKIYPTNQLVELIGNRTAAGHGNFFCIRVTPEGKVSAEVDQDNNATNYIVLYSSAGLADGIDDIWHHIAVVRQQKTLKLYIDGNLSATRTASGCLTDKKG